MGGKIKVHLKDEVVARAQGELRYNEEEINCIIKHLKIVGSMKVHKIKLMNKIYKIFKLYDH